MGCSRAAANQTCPCELLLSDRGSLQYVQGSWPTGVWSRALVSCCQAKAEDSRCDSTDLLFYYEDYQRLWMAVCMAHG